jgi:hypothetical protein
MDHSSSSVGESLVRKIQDTLRDVRSTLWSGMSKLMTRGETVEYLEKTSKELQESSRVFEVKVAVKTAPWWWWIIPCCNRRGREGVYSVMMTALNSFSWNRGTTTVSNQRVVTV